MDYRPEAPIAPQQLQHDQEPHLFQFNTGVFSQASSVLDPSDGKQPRDLVAEGQQHIYDERQPRNSIAHNQRPVDTRSPSRPLSRGSVDSDNFCSNKAQEIADVVQDESRDARRELVGRNIDHIVNSQDSYRDIEVWDSGEGHYIGKHHNEPDMTASLEITVEGGQQTIPLKAIEGSNSHVACPVAQPSLTTPTMTGLYAAEKMVAHEDLAEDDSDDGKSIFSQASLASTWTSLGNSVNISSTINMMSRVISVLFCTEGLQTVVNATAVEDSGVGPDRYRRNVRRMIKTFGLELRNEADSPIEVHTAVSLQTRSVSTHVAREIMTRAGGFQPKEHDVVATYDFTKDDLQSDASVDSADEDEEVSTGGPEDEAKIRDFILGSNACVQFKTSLLRFVHKPYERRILDALSGWHRSMLGDTVSLPQIARELSWIPPSLFSLSHDRSLGVSDQVKGLIEDTMGESWNWSPLQERRPRLQTDFSRLSWKSVSVHGF